MSAPQVTVAREGYGWIVRKDGEKVYGAVSARWRAEEARDRIEREARRKRRPCITCGDIFTSDGPGNRMCGKCRANSTAIFDGAV